MSLWAIAQCSMGNNSDLAVSRRKRWGWRRGGGSVWLLGYVAGANSGYDL